MASPSNPSWEQQLATLRSVTDTSGVVHEAQLQQLRFWGGVAFSPIKWTADIDVEGRKIIYSLAKKSKNPTLPNAVAALDNSVHWLLGESWQLIVREAGNTIYSGLFLTIQEYKQKARKYRDKRAKEEPKKKSK